MRMRERLTRATVAAATVPATSGDCSTKQRAVVHHRAWPAASLIIAILALTVAVSGPATAVLQRLAPGSVGTAQLRNSAVTSPKIADGGVRVGDLSAAARPRPPRAFRYADASSSGNIPGTWDTRAAMELPAGRFAVTAKGVMYVHNSQLTCDLGTGDGVVLDRTVQSLFTDGPTKAQAFAPMVLTDLVTLAGSATIWIRCLQEYGDLASLRDIKIVAVEVR